MTTELLWTNSAKKLEPRSEQVRGMKLIVSNGGVRLFLPPGKGKTSTVLKAFKVLRDLDLVDCLLVLAPLRVVTTSWPQELAKWLDFEDLTYEVIHGGSEGRLDAMESDVDVYLMNVEGLLTKEWRLGPKTRGYPPNPAALEFLRGRRVMLAVDESTKFKNSQATRFKTLKKYLPYFPRRVILTGTPKPNTIEDLFGQCYITDMGKDLGEYVTHFRSKYMTRDYEDGKLYPQYGAMERIAEKIAPTTLQLEDDEAMPLTVVDYWVPMPEHCKDQYRELKKEFLTEIEGKTVMAPNAGVLWGKLRQFAQGAIWVPGAGDREFVEVHGGKLDVFENLMVELGGDPLFCLFQYKHDYERICQRLGYAVPRIASGVSAAQGAAWCRAFGAGGMPLLLGQPQSVAHGVDGLQNNCNKVCWFGLDPSWENYYQANRRVARSGSKSDQVYIYRIMLDCPSERAILQLVEGKKASEEEFLQILRAHLLQ